MSGELIAILAVGATIAALIIASFRSLRSEVAKQREDMARQGEGLAALREDLMREIRSLAERVARLEGKLEVWLRAPFAGEPRQ